jgi:hypothetical protein
LASGAHAAARVTVDSAANSNDVKLTLRSVACGQETEVRVSNGTDSRTFRTDSCSGDLRNLQGPKWRATVQAGFDDRPGLALDLSILNRTNVRRSFTFRFSVGAQVVQRGRIRMHVVTYPSEYIHEGTDDFVNRCINENRQLKSRNLRLYCVIPGGRFVQREVTRL